MAHNIITVSDIVLGYGSPQILRFTKSVCDRRKSNAKILQPFSAQRPPIKLGLTDISIDTIPTSEHPNSDIGRREYIKACLRKINELRPDILIITNYTLFDLIDGLNYQPKRLIHLALEDLEPLLVKSNRDNALVKLRRLAKKVNLWVFPEANRAALDAQTLDISAEQVCIFYNVSADTIRKNEIRNERFIYAGTLDADISIGKHIFDTELASFPIDVFGDLQGTRASQAELRMKVEALRSSRRALINWHGQVENTLLEKIYPEYSFSLILWLPVRHALLNAAPNKFFQSIASGVPVISAPHPQTKTLIQRYGCGIVLEGWERHDLVKGIREAQRIMDTCNYHKYVQGCQRAFEAELSWKAQERKFQNRFNVENW